MGGSSDSRRASLRVIAREVAVTLLRAVAVQQGVVISASWLGKLKTTVQIAAIIGLIADNPAGPVVDVLVYVAVAVTVWSGADYFYGVRRRLDPEGLFANAYTERVLDPVD